MPILATSIGANQEPRPVVPISPLEIDSVPAGDLNEGFNNVTIQILESDNSGLFRFEQIQQSEALLVVNGERLALSDSLEIDVSSPVNLQVDPAAFDVRPQFNGFAYRVSYTFVGN